MGLAPWLAVAALLAAMPRPALARELREALEILEQEERDAEAAARGDALQLLPGQSQPKGPSLGVALGLSVGAPLGLAVLGAAGLWAGPPASAIGILMLAGAATVGPSLGRLYYGHDTWSWWMSGARAATLLFALVGEANGSSQMRNLADMALLGWGALIVVDIVSVPLAHPGLHQTPSLVVTPWGSADGGGLALAVSWP